MQENHTEVAPREFLSEISPNFVYHMSGPFHGRDFSLARQQATRVKNKMFTPLAADDLPRLDGLHHVMISLSSDREVEDPPEKPFVAMSFLRELRVSTH